MTYIIHACRNGERVTYGATSRKPNEAEIHYAKGRARLEGFDTVTVSYTDRHGNNNHVYTGVV